MDDLCGDDNPVPAVVVVVEGLLNGVNADEWNPTCPRGDDRVYNQYT